MKPAIKSAGGGATYVRLDVPQARQVQSFVDAKVAKYGRNDIAFNNAGNGMPRDPIADNSFKPFGDLFNTHARAVFAFMSYELPAMVKQGGGQIVNT